jgi:hypothetical protein
VTGTAAVQPAALKVRTLGHATLALYRDGSAPILLTDPWLVGSVYWRSWWLENYPSTDELDWLARAAFVYITHEHPDHFHTPSLRRLGHGPTYLFPTFPEQGFVDYARQLGYGVEVVAAAAWRALGDGISILSIPTWNDDSLLLVDTPSALILNLNDARPPKPVLRAIRRVVEAIAKPVVLARSYSPASVINSFLDDNGVVSIRAPQSYVQYICEICDMFGAKFFLPFASQAVFLREDSRWANDFRTTILDLQRFWTCRATLLQPYTTLDLESFAHATLPIERYAGIEAGRVAALTRQRLAEEDAAIFSAEDIGALERKLNAFRWLLWPGFPRGFSFQLGRRCLKYDGRHGRLVETDPAGADRGDFVIAVPTLTMKEALANDHLSDLGISMLIRIRLLRRIDPRKVYLIFNLLGLHDYHHLRGRRSLTRWIRTSLTHTFALRLPPPTRA